MFETCADIRGLMDGYMDGGLERDQLRAVRFHLNYCAACRQKLECLQSIQSELRRLPRRRIPPDISLALRVRLSQHLHNDWLSRWRVWLENSFRPLLLPASGGGLLAVICFGLLLSSQAMPLPPVARPDVPIALVTPPRLRELPPINFNTDDDQLVVLTRVGAAGQVLGYEVVSGEVSPEVLYNLDRLIYFSIFEPATAFGTPTDGKVLLSLSRITVRG